MITLSGLESVKKLCIFVFNTHGKIGLLHFQVITLKDHYFAFRTIFCRLRFDILFLRELFSL